MFQSKQVDGIRPSKNRLLIVDWASLSYHQLHALNAKAKTSHVVDFNTPEDELRVWRAGMLSKMLRYIKLFNPMDIVLTKEGDNVWRKDFVKEYYSEHAIVSYNSVGYYVRYDNFLFGLHKDAASGDIIKQKMHPIKDADDIPDNGKKLKDMPQRIQDMCWEIVLPKYKGQRSKQSWDFLVTRSDWRKYKEDFTHIIGKIFRAHILGHDEAEGDDAIYVSANHWEKKYDSIVLITCDGDMTQLKYIEKLMIFNHRTEEFKECQNPKTFCEIKILAGDKSDNIMGMALPGKATQLADKGASNLFEATSNIYAKAQAEGWDNQYLRNQRLVDLSYIPTHIQRELVESLDNSRPVTCSTEEMQDMGYPDKMIQEINTMKNVGYYTLNTKEYLESYPDLLSVDNSKQVSTQKDNQVQQAMATKRSFGDCEGVFNDPLDGDIF